MGMLIQRFMDHYKKAWETSDEFCWPRFLQKTAVTTTHRFRCRPGAQIKQWGSRTKLQADIAFLFMNNSKGQQPND